jgi:hypothetical protein
MPQSNFAKLVGDIVDLLLPLSPEDRNRVLRASLVLLGDTADPIRDVLSSSPPSDAPVTMNSSDFPLSTKAMRWTKQNGITVDQLSHLFHAAEGKLEIIAVDIPGKNNKEKVLNAYLLVGLSKFLETGTSDFDDATGRALCQSLGILNTKHHAEAFRGINEVTGSPSKGWTLTAPGLKRAALLVIDLSQTND